MGISTKKTTCKFYKVV